MQTVETQQALPWWRVPMVWLVISGPATVVVAAMATMVLAVVGADVPLRDTASAQAKTQTQTQAQTMTPAAQARNHAATQRR